MPTSTIQVDVAVKEELRNRGRLGETYNDVIRRLLDATRSMQEGRPDHLRRPTVPPANPTFAHQDRE